MGIRSIIKSIYSTFALNDNQNQQTSTHLYDLPTYKIALTVILGIHDNFLYCSYWISW